MKRKAAGEGLSHWASPPLPPQPLRSTAPRGRRRVPARSGRAAGTGASPATPAPLLPGSPGCGRRLYSAPPPLPLAWPWAGDETTPPTRCPRSPAGPGAFAGGSRAIGRERGRERGQGGVVISAQRGLIPPHSSHQ